MTMTTAQMMEIVGALGLLFAVCFGFRVIYQMIRKL